MLDFEMSSLFTLVVVLIKRASAFLIVEAFILSKGKKSKSIFWPSKDSSEIGIFLSIISFINFCLRAKFCF